MKKLVIVAIASLTVGAALAMPTKQEISKTHPLVAELMAPTMAEYKAKTKTAVDVADASVSFAESAKNEATRFIFLRGAISFYIKGGEYGKAADTVEKLKANVKDVPPVEIADVISTALGRDNMRKSPRLYSQLQLAQAQVKAARDARKLAVQLRQVSTEALRSQYAEALALTGDWKKALAEFAGISGDVGKMAKKDAEGTGSGESLGDFWWNYKTCYGGGEPVFRERAANYYRKAIAAGKIDGLKKTLIEQRLASLALPDVATTPSPTQDASIASAGRGRSPSAPTSAQSAGRAGAPHTPHPSGLVHRWSFTDGFADSVGNVAPSKSDNATVENGAVVLRSGSPLEFPAGTVPLVPFTIQVWVSATDKGLGTEGNFIFKIASSTDSDKDSVFWTWRGSTKWVSLISAFGEVKSVGHGKCLVDGQPHLYTLTGEKSGKGMLLKFYQDDTCFGERTSKFAYKKSPALILGGFVTPTYDEVRIYSRALTHAEIITSLNEGPEKVAELGKGK